MMMTIELSDAQCELLRQFARPHIRAHIEAGVEPPGLRLEIALGGPYGDDACVVLGDQRRELGEVVVRVVQGAAVDRE